VIVSPCFLVFAKPWFYPVFGLFWTHVGPKFFADAFLKSRVGLAIFPLFRNCYFTVPIAPSSRA